MKKSCDHAFEFSSDIDEPDMKCDKCGEPLEVVSSIELAALRAESEGDRPAAGVDLDPDWTADREMGPIGIDRDLWRSLHDLCRIVRSTSGESIRSTLEAYLAGSLDEYGLKLNLAIKPPAPAAPGALALPFRCTEDEGGLIVEDGAGNKVFTASHGSNALDIWNPSPEAMREALFTIGRVFLRAGEEGSAPVPTAPCLKCSNSAEHLAICLAEDPGKEGSAPGAGSGEPAEAVLLAVYSCLRPITASSRGMDYIEAVCDVLDQHLTPYIERQQARPAPAAGLPVAEQAPKFLSQTEFQKHQYTHAPTPGYTNVTTGEPPPPSQGAEHPEGAFWREQHAIASDIIGERNTELSALRAKVETLEAALRDKESYNRHLVQAVKAEMARRIDAERAPEAPALAVALAMVASAPRLASVRRGYTYYLRNGQKWGSPISDGEKMQEPNKGLEAILELPGENAELPAPSGRDAKRVEEPQTQTGALWKLLARYSNEHDRRVKNGCDCQICLDYGSLDWNEMPDDATPTEVAKQDAESSPPLPNGEGSKPIPLPDDYDKQRDPLGRFNA